jgi:hypothetical protein
VPHIADLCYVNNRVGDDDSRVVWSSKTSWLVLREELGGAQERAGLYSVQVGWGS